MKSPLLLLCSFLFPFLLHAQIRGSVYDAENRELLPYVQVRTGDTLILTSLDGAFSLKAQEERGAVPVHFKHGFYKDTILLLQPGTTTQVFLTPLAASLQEVEIVASPDHTAALTETKLLSRAALEEIRSPLGEPDLIRALQSTAGVLQTGETKSGLFVRGGTNAQTAVLMQGVPVFNSAHLLGINSSLDPDAFQSSTLYKSAYPASAGGWLSAYLLTEPRAHGVKDHQLKVGLGILSSDVSYQRYLPKLKTGIYAKAKSSYYQLLAKLYDELQVSREGENTLPDYAFGDLNIQLTTQLPGGTLSLMLFGSNDRYKAANEKITLNASWGNRLVSARWRQSLGSTWLETTHGFSHYAFAMEHQRHETDRIEQGSSAWLSNVLLGFPLAKKGVIETGAFLQMLQSQSVARNYDTEHRQLSRDVLSEQLYTSGLFIQAQLDYGSFGLSAGNRLYLYNGSLLPAPGARVQYKNTNWASPSLYYDRTYQFHQQVNVLGISMPFDFLRLASRQIPLQQADQLGLSLGKELGRYQLNAGLYHRWLQGQLYYPNATVLLKDYAQEFTAHKGRSAGLELEFQANWQQLKLNAGYTLASTKLALPPVGGHTEWVFPVQDVRHQLNAGINWKFGRGWQLAGQWFLQTGSPYTFPEGLLPVQGMTPGYNPVPTPQFGAYNNIRTPPTHRLDASVSYRRQKRRGWGEWNFGIYNVYNQANPYFFYFEVVPQEDGSGRIVAKQKSLLPLTPTVRYTWMLEL
ncbi:TonB-dependent receptor [Cesiribacter sp. SM1]|uniref:TonB-dependent receptor n=1 Tax=Cesiribacter sp. SM1 TaxID=2861196 RepID=UPI001CD5FDE9|nr:TonB-dependent receptor [Cesiribacter sp. SM1]